MTFEKATNYTKKYHGLLTLLQVLRVIKLNEIWIYIPNWSMDDERSHFTCTAMDLKNLNNRKKELQESLRKNIYKH